MRCFFRYYKRDHNTRRHRLFAACEDFFPCLALYISQSSDHVHLDPYEAIILGEFARPISTLLFHKYHFFWWCWVENEQGRNRGELVANMQRTSSLFRLFILHKTIKRETVRNHMHRAGSHEIPTGGVSGAKSEIDSAYVYQVMMILSLTEWSGVIELQCRQQDQRHMLFIDNDIPF